MSSCLGISIGSSAASVAVATDGRVEVVANEAGNRVTPAVVLFDPSVKEWLIGEAAVTKLPKIAVTEDTTPSPVKKYSLLLSKLRANAEAFAGKPATNVCLSVPVSVTEDTKAALREAATKVGFKSVSFTSTAAAACMAFDLDLPSASTTNPALSNVLVFDLGGSAVEATVLRVVDGAMQQLSSVQDSSFGGGKAFDDCLAKFCKQTFQRKYRMEVEGRRAKHRLAIACETAKRTLSTSARVNVELDSLFDGLDLNAQVTVPRFDDMCYDLFKKLAGPVSGALAEAKLAPTDIHTVVLTGGASRMPRVKRELQTFFRDHKPSFLMKTNPEETAAWGAAVEAAALAEEEEGDGASATTKDAAGSLDLAFLPRSVGVVGADGSVTTLLAANSLVPCTASKELDVPPGVSSVDVKVCQGGADRVVCVLRVALGEEDGGAESGSTTVTVSVVAKGSGELFVAAKSSSGGSLVTTTVKGGEEVVEVEAEVVATAGGGAAAGAGVGSSAPGSAGSDTASSGVAVAGTPPLPPAALAAIAAAKAAMAAGTPLMAMTPPGLDSDDDDDDDDLD